MRYASAPLSKMGITPLITEGSALSHFVYFKRRRLIL